MPIATRTASAVRTTHRYTYEVSVDAEPLERQRYGGARVERFQPQSLGIEYINGKLVGVTLQGPKIIKAGLSESTTIRAEYAHRLDEAPDYVQAAVVECTREVVGA